MVSARAHVEEDFAAGVVEHRRDHGDVGQVRAAVVRRVEHIDVARLHPAAILADHRPHALPHRAQVHRHMRRVGDQVSLPVEDGAGEIEPLLDVHRVGGVRQTQAHLLGDGHVKVVEDFELDRIDAGADRRARRPRLDPLEHHVIEARDLRTPAGLHHGRRIPLGDDGGPVDAVPRGQPLAQENRRPQCAAARMHAHPFRGLGPARRPRGRHRVGQRFRRAYGFHRDRFGDEAATGHEKAVAHAVGGLESRHDVLETAELDDERRIGAVVAQMHAPHEADAFRSDALRDQLLARHLRKPLQGAIQDGEIAGFEPRFERLLAHRDGVGEPDAVGREHARERVHEDARHAERVGDQAGVLAGRAAEAAQRVLGDVVPALHRDFLDRLGHVAHRDLDEALGDLLGRARAAGGAADLPGERREFRAHRGVVQGGIALRPEHRRKELRLDLAEHDVRVGDGERTVPAVARRARVGAGRVRPDAVARSVEMQDRAAAGGDGVDAHHRRAHAHSGHLRLEGALELPGVVGNVGRSPAHVEADDLPEARGKRGAHRADDAARRPREDAVLAGEAARVGEAAVRLHEHEAHALQFGGDPRYVTLQDRRQIGVDHRGVAARHQFHQGTHFVRRRYLLVADRAREPGDPPFVLRVAVAVHEHDRDRPVAFGVCRFQIPARALEIERRKHLAPRADALLDFDHLRIQQLGQHDVPVEEARAVLVGDAQRVAKAARDDEQRALALALEERVGRDGGAHLDDLDRLACNRRSGRRAQKAANPLDRGVAVAPGVLGKELERDDAAVGASCDHVGERAAAVDPELPAGGGVGHRLGQCADPRTLP